jgi:hypothetical protein
MTRSESIKSNLYDMHCSIEYAKDHLDSFPSCIRAINKASWHLERILELLK